MNEVLAATEPGWRPDPSGRYEWRYWDGGWTNRVANSARPAEPEPEPQPEPVEPAPAADPFAALRSQAPVADPFTALRPPAPSVAPAPAPVFTFPTSHDGTSGTVWDAPYTGGEAAPAPDPRPAGIRARIAAFVRSFWEQPESYHSPHAGPDVPPHPREAELAPPTNYGRAGLVMLAACGVAIGAYLPWLAGSIDAIPFERTGYEEGHAWGFTWAAAAFAVAAVLGARRKVFGWVTMGLSVVVAALVAHQLLDVHERVVDLNQGPTASVDVGIGLWIMLVAAAIGLIAAFRLDGGGKID